MNVKLSSATQNIKASVKITGSKSESNRLLILQALYSQIQIKNSSNSDDTRVLRQALLSENKEIDVHHAGTAMRFLTAYFTLQEGKTVLLTGSHRMQERPIKILVEALQKMGAEIEYVNKKGFPPLLIKGRKLQKNKINIKANVSSQYISALLLIAPSLENGLEIQLEEKVTSSPYLQMTLSLLKDLGVELSFEKKKIKVEHFKLQEKKKFVVESDWSSASYFYSLVALSHNTSIELSTFKKESLQGDSMLVELYKILGVKTIFLNNSIQLKKESSINLPKTYKANLINCPDLAQTIAVTCLGLGIGCELTGLHTLKIKETDRLIALQKEFTKLGAQIEITNNSLTLYPCKNLHEDITINTYKDHRMAMAFTPLATKVPLTICNAGVVSKSFPDFWKAISKGGIQVLKAG